MEKLGIKMPGFSSRKDYMSDYSIVNKATTLYRLAKVDAVSASATMDAFLSATVDEMTTKYENETNIKLKK